jgi:hypothetical protein
MMTQRGGKHICQTHKSKAGNTVSFTKKISKGDADPCTRLLDLF